MKIAMFIFHKTERYIGDEKDDKKFKEIIHQNLIFK